MTYAEGLENRTVEWRIQRAKKEVTRREISFPTGTPVPAIRCRSSQGFPRATLLGVLVALVFGSALCGAAQSATLSWDATSEPDIAGYKLHYRTADGSVSQVIDVGDTTTFSIPNIAEGITYLFTVTAYNDASLESQPLK
jgi:Fibronectin type III domain